MREAKPRSGYNTNTPLLLQSNTPATDHSFHEN
jgi:hypothetical protein